MTRGVPRLLDATNTDREEYLERGRHKDAALPPIGAPAPSFNLPVLGDEERTIDLFSLRGSPVVLVFGSYSCGPFEKSLSKVNRLFQAHKDLVTFYLVYTREQHEGRPSKHRPTMQQSSTIAERSGNATMCVMDRKVEMPVLLDLPDDSVAHAYGGLPNRFYLLDENGLIVFRSDHGPKGADIEQVDTEIRQYLANRNVESG